MPNKLKLLIHVAQADKWDTAAGNAINFLKTKQTGEELRVRMIANADAVTRCTQCDRPLFDVLKQIVLEGGEIYLCENALRNFGIHVSRLPEIFKTVPAGIRALVELQNDGWRYVRP
ncbi:MAG: DsrE family protein [Dissulfurimicrobium sp.]|uniref:DsrE family protein n=1 Tax=Dissulfurimicrobium TaxID=1769732 RepID=UPI001EDA9862|nr:DsrE family protein [Dissulfurimicrobium hydrothermale]UKL13327.1 DsrE family protein [Dissulfurimicrobium hydrothermale]